MDGYDLIDTVRMRLKLSPERLPAIALSGYASLADRERSLARGFQLHLAKPVDVETLPTTIVSLVKQKTQ
jgi:CheY-like chemotaxis protein